MAPRKDQMRIIRQDAGFSAKLGFGGPMAKIGDVGDEIEGAGELTPAVDVAMPSASAKTDVVSLEPAAVGEPARPLPTVQDRSREEKGVPEHLRRGAATSTGAGPSSTTSPRGHVVYVAVSLTARQVTLAEAWATAAKCSVQFLIRRVAQGLREEVFDEWEAVGMPDIDEPRGARGRHPTSVTMTLRPEFAAALSAQHDPLGIVGLARVMGPAFRARFETAFDAALAKANLQPGTKGDEE